MNPEQRPFRGRGRGITPNRGPTVSAGVPTPGPSPPATQESGIPLPGMANLSISSSSSPSAVLTSSSSSSGISGRVSRAARSTSPVSTQQRGTHRGFRHDRTEAAERTRREDLVSKQGKNGEQLPLKANYFELIKAPSWSLYQYHVQITPTVDLIRLRKALVGREADRFGGYIYDGDKMLYSSTLLAEEEVHCQVADNRDPTIQYGIRFRMVSQLEPGDSQYLQVYNIILKKCLHAMGLKEMGRNFYDIQVKIPLTAYKLVVVPGFMTSIRQHENNVLLCVETTTKVLRTDTVLDNFNDLRSQPNYQRAAEDLIIGTIVLTSYNNKTYSIAEVDWSQNPRSTFDFKGTPTSYVQYYKDKYGLEIKNLDQPLLKTRPNKKDFHRKDVEPISLAVIPELCQMTGLTPAMRSNFSLMKDLSGYMHTPPQKRIETIQEFMRRLLKNDENNKLLDSWQLQFHPKVIDVPGRILKKQDIIFKGGIFPGSDNADWTMAFRKFKMLSVPNQGLRHWTVIVPQRDAGDVDNLVATMNKVGTPLGLPIPRPTQIVKIANASPQSYLRAIDEVQGKPNDFIFIVLANNKPELYGSIKRRLTGDLGKISQCFLAKNLKSKGLMSIATKVVIQINAKLGGEPWTIQVPLKNLMVVGLDVYHGTKTTEGKNVAAMVASVSPTHSRFFSTVSLYDSSDELSRCVTSDLLKCLNAYRELNGKYPEKLLFFRDGVGDGDLDAVIRTELTQVKQSLEAAYASSNEPLAKFTFVVVSKRINTRVFTADVKEARNPPPGTVVDDVVTLPERYDFYLIPQTARQGAVSPSAYNVLHDTMNLDPDKIQLLTYKFCHLYFNWSGTVAVPAHCQYAHKLANLIGVAVGKENNPELAYNLHYL